MAELDPRFEWLEVFAHEQAEPVRYIRGRCRHLTPEPVHDLTGRPVAQLCPDCDTQLPPHE